MHLFKRLLLTKFPNSTIHNVMNPASMFVGFISAKEFFSVINRKIIENPKLNLFDANLDVIEFKMGFWDDSNSNDQKDLETYFAYAVAANLNGTLFYSPANLWNGIALLSAVFFKDIMKEFPSYFFIQLIYSIYLLTFTFTSRVKVFPSENEQENYNWFIDVFFDFYRGTFDQLQTKISDQEYKEVKSQLLQETSFCFLLFHFYKKLNSVLENKSSTTDYLDWLLGKEKGDTIIKAFKENYETTKYLPHSSPLEQNILNRIWPADILIKYLFWESDPILAVETIVEKIFNKQELIPLVNSFLKSDNQLPQLFQYLLEYKKYKYWFFAGVQNYLIKLLRVEGKDDILEDIDEMASSIDNGDDFSNFDVPERIKRESKVTERLLNFYVTLLWWFTTARWDSFYLRLFKPNILNYFTKDSLQNLLDSDIQIDYYWNILFQYGKNLYYYNYIDKNIRAGKSKFSMPIKWDNWQVPTNFSVIKLFTEWMISSFFQDLNPKDTKLLIKNSQILDLFRKNFWEKISELVKLSKNKFIEKFYQWWIENLSEKKKIYSLLELELSDDNLVNLKDSLYKLDYWVTNNLYEKLQIIRLNNKYDDALCLTVYWMLRETLFWFMLLYSYFQKQEKVEKSKNDILIMYYVKDILWLRIPEATEIYDAILETIKEFSTILELWTGIDDNPWFLKLIEKSRKTFCSKKDDNQIFWSIAWEDLLRFRGLLKNITYYNKRYVIPW